MPNSEPLNSCIPNDEVDQLPIYENEQKAWEAVDQALQGWMKKELIDWAKQQVDFRKQSANRSNRNKFIPVLLDYFDSDALEIIKDLFNIQYINKDQCLSESLTIFADECIKKLTEKNKILLYQGSSILVFYRDGHFVRALKPKINQSGLRDKNNENLRLIGSKNNFKKHGFSLTRWFSSDKQDKAPHLSDMMGNQINFDDRQGILIVYEKEPGAKIGAEFYSMLDEAIADMLEKRKVAQANSPETKVNIKMLMDDLYEAACKLHGLLSCHLYDIEKTPGENGEDIIKVYRYTVKKNTLDPVDAALTDYEKENKLAMPIKVNAKVSINHHYWEKCKGYISIFVKTLCLAAILFLVAGVLLSCAPLWIAIPAFCVALTVPSFYAWKKIDQLERLTKNTEEYSDPTLKRLHSFRIKNIFPSLFKGGFTGLDVIKGIVKPFKEIVHVQSEVPDEDQHPVTTNDEHNYSSDSSLSLLK